MTHEVFMGGQVRLTAQPNSHTLEGRGVFPMIDGGNNIEAQGAASKTTGEANKGAGKERLVILAPTRVIESLKFAADHPLSTKVIGLYESSIAKKPIDTWQRGDYIDVLVALNKTSLEAIKSNVPEPQEIAIELIEDLFIRAARAGESPFGVTREVNKKLGNTMSPEELGDFVSRQLLRLSLEGKITEDEAFHFMDLPDPVPSSPKGGKGEAKTSTHGTPTKEIVSPPTPVRTSNREEGPGRKTRSTVEKLLERYEDALERGETNFDAIKIIRDELGLESRSDRFVLGEQGQREFELELKAFQEKGGTFENYMHNNAAFQALFGARPGDPVLGPLWDTLEAALTGHDWRDFADDSALFNTSAWVPVVGVIDAAHPPAIIAEARRYQEILHEVQMHALRDRIGHFNDLSNDVTLSADDRAEHRDTARAHSHRYSTGEDKFKAILARSDVNRELLQSGEELDFSENGPLRHLLREMDEIDLDSQFFNDSVHTFARREVGTEISKEAKERLLEYLAERFLNWKDALPTEEYEMPSGLYIPGNFLEIQRLARIGFRGDIEPYKYITMLKKQRHYMHELFRILPNQEQYIQWIALQVGDVGLDFVYNDVAGVIDCVALFERYAWYTASTTSHSQHRILNDGEFQKITGNVKNVFLEMQQEGLLRDRTGRLLTPWEAERAYVLARSAFSGMQRMGISMGWGGAPAHSSQIYRPAAQSGIQKRLMPGKFSEQGLMGYPPGRHLMKKTFEWAKNFDKDDWDPEGLRRKRYVDGVGGISDYTAWINTIGAPDIQTNPSRSVAMTFTDIWFRRNAGTTDEEQTTLLNVLHEIGAVWKDFYFHKHGVEGLDRPDGYVGNDEFAKYISGEMTKETDDFHNSNRFTFFADEVLKQRLFVSYLAQYDGMPTDLKEKFFKKMAVLNPSNMISFLPALRSVAIHEAHAAGATGATWESLHKKLLMHEGQRVNEEGAQMISYNDTLKIIRDGKHPDTKVAYGGDVALARHDYDIEKGAIDAAHPLASTNNPGASVVEKRAYKQALNALHEKWKMDLENFEAWETKLRDELFATKNDFNPTIRSIVDTVTGATRMMRADESTQIANARYAMRDRIFGTNLATLTPQEQAEYQLLTKIIDLSLDPLHTFRDKEGNESVAKIVSEAKLAYKVCLDDTPRISWRATGEGGGGGGKGMILSMYGDQTAVDQGVNDHLAHLMLDPINKAEENLAGLVHQFSNHYGMPDAQEMFKPLIVAFLQMVKENGWARWGGKAIRDFLQKPNSEMEEYFKVKGYALDEINIFKLCLNLTNHHAIGNEKETVGKRLQEIIHEYRHATHADRWQTVKDIFTNKHFRDDLLYNGIVEKELFGRKKKGTSELDQILKLVGADPKGRRRNYRRRFLQLLMTLGLAEIVSLFTSNAKKEIG